MQFQEQVTFTPEQEAHLNAWSMVYIDALIQEKLDITLSQFLIDPGKYLFLTWLTAPRCATTNGFLPLLPAQVVASRRIHQQWEDEDEQN